MGWGIVGTVEGATVEAGMDVEAVGGGVVGSVVGGASVVGVVVAGGGGGAVAGGLVPVLRGAVNATVGWVVKAPPAPTLPPAVVEVVSTVVDVDVTGAFDVVVTCAVDVVTRAVVDVDWVATCCWGDVSLPVTTSNRRAARAIDARA